MKTYFNYFKSIPKFNLWKIQFWLFLSVVLVAWSCSESIFDRSLMQGHPVERPDVPFMSAANPAALPSTIQQERALPIIAAECCGRLESGPRFRKTPQPEQEVALRRMQRQIV